MRHTGVTQRFGLTVVTTNSSSVAAGPSETLVEAVNATTGAVLSSGKRLCIGPNLNYYDAIVPSSTEPKFMFPIMCIGLGASGRSQAGFTNLVTFVGRKDPHMSPTSLALARGYTDPLTGYQFYWALSADVP